MTATEVFALLEAFAIVIIGGIGFWSQWSKVKTYLPAWQWIKYGLAIVCLTWAIFYILIIADTLIPDFEMHTMVIRTWLLRPLILFTVTFIACNAIARKHTNGH